MLLRFGSNFDGIQNQFSAAPSGGYGASCESETKGDSALGVGASTGHRGARRAKRIARGGRPAPESKEG